MLSIPGPGNRDSTHHTTHTAILGLSQTLPDHTTMAGHPPKRETDGFHSPIDAFAIAKLLRQLLWSLSSPQQMVQILLRSCRLNIPFWNFFGFVCSGFVCKMELPLGK